MFEDNSDINPYLQQEVLTASPVRLRRLLIDRAGELCAAVEALWGDQEFAVGDQWMLRIQEILGELLAGVTGQNPVSQPVSDLYVFLIRLSIEAMQQRDQAKLRQIKDLLAIESETWRMVDDQQRSESHPLPPAPMLSLYEPVLDTSGGSFSLDM